MLLIDLTNKLEWMAKTSYSAGDILRDNNIPDGYIATCTTAGISGETEPEWQVGTLTDGTITWNVAVDPNYYEKATKASAQAAAESAAQSAKSAQAAETAATSAGTHALSAAGSEKNAKTYADNAMDSATSASASADSASGRADSAHTSETNAKASEDNAKASETNAKASETNAAKSAEDAANSAKQAAENIPAAYIASVVKTALDERTKAMYPVGCYFYSDDSRAPSEYIPGLEGTTWEQTAAGRVLIGAGTADSGTVYTAGDKGGEEKHKLSAAELPKVNPTVNIYDPKVTQNVARNCFEWKYDIHRRKYTMVDGRDDFIVPIGGDSPHNNMQPYQAVYIFRRSA